MVDVRGDVLRPPHGTTPAAEKSNIKSEMRSFKSNENIHKKEGGYTDFFYINLANKRQRKVIIRRVLLGSESYVGQSPFAFINDVSYA